MKPYKLSEETKDRLSRYDDLEDQLNTLRQDTKVKRYLSLLRDESLMEIQLRKDLSFSIADALEELPDGQISVLATFLGIQMKENTSKEAMIQEMSQALIEDRNDWIENLPYLDLETLREIDMHVFEDGMWAPLPHQGRTSILEMFGIIRPYWIWDERCGILPNELTDKFKKVRDIIDDYPQDMRRIEKIRIGILNTYGLVPSDEIIPLLLHYAKKDGFTGEDIEPYLNKSFMKVYFTLVEGKAPCYRTPSELYDISWEKEVLDFRLKHKGVSYKDFSLEQILENADNFPEPDEHTVSLWKRKGFTPAEFKEAKESARNYPIRPSDQLKGPVHYEIVKPDRSIDPQAVQNYLDRLSPEDYQSAINKIVKMLKIINPPIDKDLIPYIFSWIVSLPEVMAEGPANIEFQLTWARINAYLAVIIDEFNDKVPRSPFAVRKRVAPFGSFLKRTLEELPIRTAPRLSRKAMDEIPLNQYNNFHIRMSQTLMDNKNAIEAHFPELRADLIEQYDSLTSSMKDTVESYFNSEKPDSRAVVEMKKKITDLFFEYMKALSSAQNPSTHDQLSNITKLFWKESFLT